MKKVEIIAKDWEHVMNAIKDFNGDPSDLQKILKEFDPINHPEQLPEILKALKN